MSGFMTSMGVQEGQVKQEVTEIKVGDTETCLSLACSSYIDRHFVIVTQNELCKLGTLITGEMIIGADGTVHYEINVIFGKRDDQLLLVYCRQIIEKIYKAGSKKPLLFAIALLEDGRSVECFQAVLNKLDEIATW